jgi:nicotinamidase-related amidase
MTHPGIWDSTECALVLVDYQDDWLSEIHEQDPNVIAYNVVTLADFAKRMKMPIVLSTVAVKMGYNGPTFKALAETLPDVEPIDRTTMNAWEDPAFQAAAKATGRRKLIMGGLLTSVCLVYPAVSALKDGFEVMFVSDAHGDVSLEAHDRACERMIQAGAVPSTTAGAVPSTTAAIIPSCSATGPTPARPRRDRSSSRTPPGLSLSVRDIRPCLVQGVPVDSHRRELHRYAAAGPV